MDNSTTIVFTTRISHGMFVRGLPVRSNETDEVGMGGSKIVSSLREEGGHMVPCIFMMILLIIFVFFMVHPHTSLFVAYPSAMASNTATP